MIKLCIEISDGDERSLQQPVFVDSAMEIGLAVKQAVDDLVEAYDTNLQLPLSVAVNAAPEDGFCPN